MLLATLSKTGHTRWLTPLKPSIQETEAGALL